ncbi:MAG: hypothetical protein HYY17_12505 [Planctomycetes bacterium]|nr:hypothetical protein [Planctomycetota bacterium]
MYRAAFLSAGASILLLVSCAKPERSSFVKALDRHFANLNTEALSRRDLLLAQMDAFSKNPAMTPPVGMQYNTYHFSDKGFILLDFPCGRPACGRRYAVVDYYGSDKLCPACGSILVKARPKEAADTRAWLAGETRAVQVPDKFKDAAELENWQSTLGGKPAIMPMLMISEKSPDFAIAVYVRRNWSFDTSGRSDVDVSKMGDSKWKAEVKTDYLPGTGGKVGPGFHRPDTAYIEIQGFQLGGQGVRAVGQPRSFAVDSPSAAFRDIRLEPEAR